MGSQTEINLGAVNLRHFDSNVKYPPPEYKNHISLGISPLGGNRIDPRTEETIRLLYNSVKRRRGKEEAELFLNRVKSLLSEEGYDEV